jgi:hypothetical protein
LSQPIWLNPLIKIGGNNYVYEQNMLWKWCLSCKWFNIRK